MKIEDLQIALNKIKRKAGEVGVVINNYTMWADEMTFEDDEGFVFATYYCEHDEIEYE